MFRTVEAKIAIAKRGIYKDAKVTLKGSKPPIWIRIQVTDDITLHHLHQILQVVMGWSDYHLHQFVIGGTYTVKLTLIMGRYA